MPSRKYAGKVLIVTLSDVAYANDYASYMYDQKLAAYVECHGVGQRLMFYIVGSDRELNNAVLYCYNNYNTKFRKVAKTRSVNWEDAQPRTQALSSGKERPWSELVTCHPDSGW